MITFEHKIRLHKNARKEEGMKRVLCYGDSNTHGCNPEWKAEWDADPEKSVRFSEHKMEYSL